MAHKRRAKKNKRTVDLDKMKKKLEKLGQGKFFKADEGSNTVRIMPPFDDSGSFYIEACHHHGLQIEEQNRAFCCKEYHEKAPCPICFYIEDLNESDKEDAGTILKRVAQRVKYFVNVYNYKKEVYQIWGFSAKILRKILGYLTDPDWGDITDPDEGHDMVIDREGTGLKTKYDLRIKPKPKAFPLDDYDSKLFDLDKECVELEADQVVIDAIEGTFGDFDIQGWKKYKKAWLEENDADDEEEEEESDTSEEEEEEEAEDEEEEDDFEGMDRAELKAYIKENDLDIKVLKKDSDDDLRDKIREA